MPGRVSTFSGPGRCPARIRFSWSSLPCAFKEEESSRPFSSAAGAFFQVPHHLIHAEAARPLPRRELLEAGNPLRHVDLSRHQKENAAEFPIGVINRIVLGLFEWIATQIEEQRHP